MSWYQQFYQPKNAIIVIVGDVSPQAVFKLAQDFFADITNLTLSAINIAPQASQQAQQKLQPLNTNIAAKTRVGMLLQAFKVPVIRTTQPLWEAYALEVLAAWLDSGINSRLTKNLVKDKLLANQVAVIYSPLTRQDSLFIIEALPAHNISLTQLEHELNQEIEQLKQEKITEKTLSRIKNQIIATAIFEQDSIQTQAKIIGQAEVVGIHWSDDAKYIERIKSVTAIQLQQVLKKYFVPELKTTIFQPAFNP